MRDNIKEYEAVAKAAENFVRSVAEWKSHVRLTPCDKVRLTPENN